MDPYHVARRALASGTRGGRRARPGFSDVVELTDNLAETPGSVLNTRAPGHVLKLNMALDHLGGTIYAGAMPAPPEQGGSHCRGREVG